MPYHFCPQCGTKLQPVFRFCPACGEKLPDTPSQEESPIVNISPLKIDGTDKTVDQDSLSASRIAGPDCTPSTTVSTRPPLRKTRRSLHTAKEESTSTEPTTLLLPCSPKQAAVEGDVNTTPKASPVKPWTKTPKKASEVEPAAETLSSNAPCSPIAKGRVKRAKRAHSGACLDKEGMQADGRSTKEEEPVVEAKALSIPSPVSSPFSSPIARSPSIVKGNAKKAKRVCAVVRLEEGEELTDTTGHRWRLGNLLTHTTTDLIYDVTASHSKEPKYIIKLGAKDGKIFNEQNFLQRAAKPSSVTKWMKNMKMDFLGIPSCTGFGLHGDTYRFLVFPNMGHTLQAIAEERQQLLSEKAVLQLGCRILDVLEYIHSNEYVHADIHAENIYINPEEEPQVYLVGYCHAFRYRPGGVHVEYREASRSLHEGALEFISLDSHRGAGPSRRSDLQSLGYCMLSWLTGTLPWTDLTSDPSKVTAEKQKCMEDVSGLIKHCFAQKRVSSALHAYLTKVMALQYSEEPDYRSLKAELADALSQLGGSVQDTISL